MLKYHRLIVTFCVGGFFFFHFHELIQIGKIYVYQNTIVFVNGEQCMKLINTYMFVIL